MERVMKMGKSNLATINVPAYSGNYTKGRSQKISKITIHHMAGIMTAEQCGKLWQKVGRKGSSHYGIGNDGTIANYVDELNTAWTDSNWSSNCKSVTIETSNDSTGGEWHVGDKALNSLIKLVADIAKRNGLGTLVKGQNITWHSMYSATACPGDYLRSKMDYIVSEANKINSNATSKPVSTNTGSSTKTTNANAFLPKRGYFKLGDVSANVGKIAKFMRSVFPSYTSVKALGNTYGPNLIKSVTEFQKRTGLTPDGYFGPITLAKLVSFGFRY